MHHQGHPGPSARLHDADRLKTKLHHHRLRAIQTNQAKRHDRRRPACKTQPSQSCACLAEQNCHPVGQAPRIADRPFVPKEGLHVKWQALQIGANERFADRTTAWRQNQQPRLRRDGVLHQRSGSAKTERQWGSTTPQSREQSFSRAAAPKRSRKAASNISRSSALEKVRQSSLGTTRPCSSLVYCCI